MAFEAKRRFQRRVVSGPLKGCTHDDFVALGRGRILKLEISGEPPVASLGPRSRLNRRASKCARIDRQPLRDWS